MDNPDDFVAGERQYHEAAMAIGVLSHLKEQLAQLDLPPDQVVHFTRNVDEGLNVTMATIRMLGEEITWGGVMTALERAVQALAEQEDLEIDEE